MLSVHMKLSALERCPYGDVPKSTAQKKERAGIYMFIISLEAPQNIYKVNVKSAYEPSSSSGRCFAPVSVA